MRKIELTSGKTEFETFKTKSGKTFSPCINGFNLDWYKGCQAGFNPYFQNGEEIVTGSILELGRKKVLSRLDDLYDKRLEALQSHGLYPEVKRTTEFSEGLKGKIWNIIQNQVKWYQTHRRKDRETGKVIFYTAEHLERYMKTGIGILDGWLNSCEYCYSRQNNNSQLVRSDDIDLSLVEEQIKEAWEKEDTIKDRKGNERLFIRMGKRTETASIFHLQKLDEILDICLRNNVSLSLPTKFLPYEPTIAEKLRATNSMLGYSIAYEKMENGVVLFGFDNDYRLECAEKYASQCDTMLKLSWDVTGSLEEIDQNGGDSKKVIKFLKENPHVKKQLIPMRTHRHSVIGGVTGGNKKELIKTVEQKKIENAQADLFREEKQPEVEPRFKLSQGQRLLANQIGVDIAEMFPKQRCGQIGDKYNCDSCQFENLPTYKLNMTNHVPIVDSINNEKRKKEKLKEKEKERKSIFVANLIDLLEE